MLKQIFILGLLITPITLQTAEPTPPEIGIDDTFLGKKVDLDLDFFDETGEPITLAEASGGRPIVLALVYYNCTSICNPFLNAIVDVINQSPKGFLPGNTYNVIALSFDPSEKFAIAAMKKQSYYNLFEGKQDIPESAFRFLTGDSANINKLTESVGFLYTEDGTGGFMHASSIIVLSPSGLISKYIRGLYFLPVELMISVTDAMEGRWAPTVRKIVKFCFTEEPEGRGYYFNFLKVTGVLILATILFTMLILSRMIQKKQQQQSEETKGN